MNERGAPSPVAWTRLRAPQGSMSPTPPATMQATVDASPLLTKYGTPIDPESAREILAKKINAAATASGAVDEAARVKAEYDQAVKDMQKAERGTKPTTTRTSTRSSTRKEKNVLEEVFGSRSGQTVIREVLRGVFSTLKRK